MGYEKRLVKLIGEFRAGENVSCDNNEIIDFPTN